LQKELDKYKNSNDDFLKDCKNLEAEVSIINTCFFNHKILVLQRLKDTESKVSELDNSLLLMKSLNSTNTGNNMDGNA